MNATRILPVSVCLTLLACGAGPRAVREQQRREAELAAQDDQADEPYQVAASHILISYAGAERADVNVTRSKPEAHALAAELLERLQTGADFAELAREYSDGPSGPNGGSLGSFSRSKMTQAFSDAAFGLEVGALYPEPVETEFGYHLIRRDQ